MSYRISEKFELYNSDQHLADRLVSFLTNLTREPEVKNEKIAYRNNLRLQHESIAPLDQKLGQFVKGVKLQTRRLGGTCYQCRNAT